MLSAFPFLKFNLSESFPKAQTRSYRDVSLLSGAVLLFVAYSYFMFAPTVFDVYLIYFMSLIALLVLQLLSIFRQ